MCLQPRLDYIEGTCDDASETTSHSASEELEGHADLAVLLIAAGPGLELFPEHKLEGGEWQIAV